MENGLSAFCMLHSQRVLPMPTATVPHNTQASVSSTRRRHVLDLDDFTSDEIGEILETAASMKEILSRPIPQAPVLRGLNIVNLFYEDSTRTRISFELAAKALSANVVNMSA